MIMTMIRALVCIEFLVLVPFIVFSLYGAGVNLDMLWALRILIILHISAIIGYVIGVYSV